MDDDDDAEGLVRKSLAQESEDSDDDNGSVSTDMSVKRALVKLRNGVRAIRGSPMRLEKFKLMTTPVGKKQGLAPLLNVRTRWGSTYTMIQRAVQCKDAYNSVLIDLDLTDYVLDELEWRQLGALMDLLRLFDQLTTQMCASKTYTTIAMSIVVYNKLMQEIEDFVKRNKEKGPDICRGATASYDKLK
ncbi:hypothetical protein BGX30_008675, partial [Mortierella sp. GBA39]